MATIYDGFEAATTLTGTEIIPMVQNGKLVKSTVGAAATSVYKVYTALLSQSGTNIPTAIVLQNTLSGVITWQRLDVGFYRGTLTGEFTLNKTSITTSQTGSINNSYFNIVVNTAGLGLNSFTFDTFTDNVHDDSVLLKTPIEIRVYP